MVFGDSIYRGILQNITSYYQAILPGVLTPPVLKINASCGLLGSRSRRIMALPAVSSESATRGADISLVSSIHIGCEGNLYIPSNVSSFFVL